MEEEPEPLPNMERAIAAALAGLNSEGIDAGFVANLVRRVRDAPGLLEDEIAFAALMREELQPGVQAVVDQVRIAMHAEGYELTQDDAARIDRVATERIFFAGPQLRAALRANRDRRA